MERFDAKPRKARPASKVFEQRELINAGDFMGAQQMDIDDIHSKFGNKYNKAINEGLYIKIKRKWDIQ